LGNILQRPEQVEGRVFTRALMKLGYFPPLALKQAHLSASVNVGSGEPRFLICSPEYMRETRSKFVVDLVAFDFSRGQSGNFRVADRGVQRKGSRNGAGTLFTALDDALLEPDHHKWPAMVGDQVSKSATSVWEILCTEWSKVCLDGKFRQELASAVLAAMQ
jgi:hypothetical protein